MGLGLAGIIGIVALVIVALPLLAGAVLVILIVANRADPDPTGRRPAVVYSFAISFITLFVTLFSTFVVVAQLWSLIGSHHTSTSSDDVAGLLADNTVIAHHVAKHPYGDSVARAVVIALLLAVVAGYIYLKHARAGERATAGVRLVDPAGRVRSSYVAAVSFVCVVIAMISTVVAAYQLFRIAAPGVFNSGGTGSRVAALRILVPLVYLALASLILLRRHVQQLPPGARPFFSAPPGEPGPGNADAEIAEEVIEVDVLDAGPPPRKRAPRKTTPTKTTPPKE